MAGRPEGTLLPENDVHVVAQRRRIGIPDSGEKRCAYRVFTDGVERITARAPLLAEAHWRTTTAAVRAALLLELDWAFGPCDYPFHFEALCDWLDLDADGVRRDLLRVVQRHRAWLTTREAILCFVAAETAEMTRRKRRRWAA